MSLVNGMVRVAWCFGKDSPYALKAEKEQVRIRRGILRQIARRIPGAVLERWYGWVFKVDAHGHKPAATVKAELQRRIRQDLPGTGLSVGPFDGVCIHVVDKRICYVPCYLLRLGRRLWVIRIRGVEVQMKIELEWDIANPPGRPNVVLRPAVGRRRVPARAQASGDRAGSRAKAPR